jgi:uncharacterized lipoprotein YddW (UPF0748 family)
MRARPRLPSRLPLSCLLLTSLLASARGAAGAAVHEMRGLWVVRTALVSPEAVDRAVDQAAEAGFSTLFVQVRGRGDAFYASRLAPRSPLLERQRAGFDPLKRLLERARERRLQVHAWINVLLSAGFAQAPAPGHVVARHPEWLMVPRPVARAALEPGAPLLALVREASQAGTDAEGYYLSPSARGVAEHLEAVVGELIGSYAVDGLHLDFIRYPGPEFDYSRAALEGFARRQGGVETTVLPDAWAPAWIDYRREALTALAERLARAARSQRTRLVVSAAVVPDEASALGHKFQAWPAWLARGILDAVCPMAYTPDGPTFVEQLERARAHARNGQRVWAGVGAYRLPLAETIERIGLARRSGADGVVVFSHESLAAEDLERFREGAFGAGPAQGGLGAPALAKPR